VSGWVIDELGHIPRVGDKFRYENLEVTVTATLRMRVLEIRVRVLPEEEDKREAGPLLPWPAHLNGGKGEAAAEEKE
jgi:Mg2+/Co2+ transporter CorC